MKRSVVLFSGGQDSTTALLAAKAETEVLGALHVRYGQRHAVETVQAARIAHELGVPFQIVEIPAFTQLGNSALVTRDAAIAGPHPNLATVPASFVPGRNLVLLTLAAAYAMKLGAAEVYTGVCQTDYSGYPDCREPAIAALQTAIRAGMDFDDLHIHTPLMDLTKAQTFALADKLGGLKLVLEHSHTCYEGLRTTRFAWGWGCGECPSCLLRAKGWEEYQTAMAKAAKKAKDRAQEPAQEQPEEG